MIVEGGGSGDIPAGYTYLGQFIDHDLTMDRTTVIKCRARQAPLRSSL